MSAQNKSIFLAKAYRALLPEGFRMWLYQKRNPITGEDSGWSGDYNSWKEVSALCSGYDNSIILNKVKESVLKVKNGEAEYERDSVTFDKHEYSLQLLDVLKTSVLNNELSIIDFGGSLGSLYFQYKRFFNGVKINWMVVEQNHFVDCGKKEIANNELGFFESIEEALKYKPANTIILSSVLPYIEKPYELIDKIKSFNFKNIIIERNPFIEGTKELLTLQNVPEYIYKASYPAWFFNEEKFVKAFSDKYELIKEINESVSGQTLVNNKKAQWKGFLFKNKHE